MGKALQSIEKLLADTGALFPGIWREADHIRHEHSSLWHPGVFMPFDAWHVLMQKYRSKMILDGSEVQAVQIWQALGAWRPAKDIARFDPALYEALAATPLVGDLPSEVLLRLPAWAVYVEAPDIRIDGEVYEGFFVYLEQKMERGEMELRFLFAGEEKMCPYIVPLGAWPLAKALDDIVQETRRKAPGDVKPDADYGRGLETAVSLTLYLCAYGFSDMERPAAQVISYPQPKKTKKGWRLFAPDTQKVHHLGEELGRKLAEASRPDREQGAELANRAPVRPHIRRAHWHGFWSGPKSDADKRLFGLKWLPPMAIAMREEGEEDGD